MKTKSLSRFFLFNFICLIAISANAMAFDLSSPRATVHSFVGSYNQVKLQQAALCVVGADPAEASPLEELAAIRKDDETSQIIIRQLDITIDDSAKTATATTALQLGNLKDEFGHSNNRFVSHLRLKFQDGKWKIVPDKFKYKPARNIRDPLNYIAALLADPEAIKIISQHERIATCQSNLKQLSLTIFMFTQDHNETYTFTNETWIESLKPYFGVTNRPILICPDDKPQHEQLKTSYSFNDNLTNASWESIDDPTKTIMLYEGKDGELNFRHNGKANVAFVDGHVKAVDAEEAKSLLWKP
jgi:prepilin-type processing-associated H-X9-DG protein